jgi:hypothetical protein
MIEHNIPNDVFQKIYDFLLTVSKIHIKNEEKVRVFIEAIYYSKFGLRLLRKNARVHEIEDPKTP